MHLCVYFFDFVQISGPILKGRRGGGRGGGGKEEAKGGFSGWVLVVGELKVGWTGGRAWGWKGLG